MDQIQLLSIVFLVSLSSHMSEDGSLRHVNHVDWMALTSFDAQLTDRVFNIHCKANLPTPSSGKERETLRGLSAMASAPRLRMSLRPLIRWQMNCATPRLYCSDSQSTTGAQSPSKSASNPVGDACISNPIESSTHAPGDQCTCGSRCAFLACPVLHPLLFNPAW